MPGREVVVIGAAGAQAQAMLGAARRAGAIDGWVGVDRAWSERERLSCEEWGLRTVELDLLAEPERLCETIAGAALVANFAGPYYRTGVAVLDACIEMGCDYLDICDDADATLDLLGRSIDAGAAGVRALIGMGSSPGVTNVFVRAGFDALGEADEARLSWIVDVTDELTLRTSQFPSPLCEQTVDGPSHPEPITVPRFLGIESVRNFGSVVPAVLYRHFRRTCEASDYLGGGLVVDVWSGEEGIRFALAERSSVGESTGAPAAAGVLLMLDGGPEDSGVFAPECLDPAEFFAALGRCSRGSGSLGAYRLWGSEQGERIRIRDLLSTRVR